MSADSLLCPSCNSNQIVKNGKIHNGKQNYKCRDCGRQFVKNPKNKIIAQNTKNLIDKLLLKKIPLAGIARVSDVSESSRFAADRPGGLERIRVRATKLCQ